MRRATKVASATISPTIANSDGWTSIGPTLIHRPAPCALWPIAKTASRPTIESP